MSVVYQIKRHWWFMAPMSQARAAHEGDVVLYLGTFFNNGSFFSSIGGPSAWDNNNSAQLSFGDVAMFLFNGERVFCPECVLEDAGYIKQL